MKNIPPKYHAKIRQMIKKAREDERKKIFEIKVFDKEKYEANSR